MTITHKHKIVIEPNDEDGQEFAKKLREKLESQGLRFKAISGAREIMIFWTETSLFLDIKKENSHKKPLIS